MHENIIKTLFEKEKVTRKKPITTTTPIPYQKLYISSEPPRIKPKDVEEEHISIGILHFIVLYIVILVGFIFIWLAPFYATFKNTTISPIISSVLFLCGGIFTGILLFVEKYTLEHV